MTSCLIIIIEQKPGKWVWLIVCLGFLNVVCFGNSKPLKTMMCYIRKLQNIELTWKVCFKPVLEVGVYGTWDLRSMLTKVCRVYSAAHSIEWMPLFIYPTWLFVLIFFLPTLKGHIPFSWQKSTFKPHTHMTCHPRVCFKNITFMFTLNIAAFVL